MMTQVDPRGIARLAIAMAWVFLAVDLALAAGALLVIRGLGGLGGPIAPVETLTRIDLFNGGVALLYTVVFIVAVVAIGRWIYVTNRNAQGWSGFVDITPGWNVGWFFVPIANLWKPYEGVRETYQASVDPVEPAGVPVPTAMRIWWGTWVVTGILGNISFQLAMRSDGVGGLIASSWLNVISAPIDVIVVFALTAVIRRTTAAQVARLGGPALALQGANA